MESYSDYICSYSYDGDRWEFTIVAKSMEDALKRLEWIRRSGKVDGEIMFTVPIPGVPGFFTKLKKKFWPIMNP